MRILALLALAGLVLSGCASPEDSSPAPGGRTDASVPTSESPSTSGSKTTAGSKPSSTGTSSAGTTAQNSSASSAPGGNATDAPAGPVTGTCDLAMQLGLYSPGGGRVGVNMIDACEVVLNSTGAPLSTGTAKLEFTHGGSFTELIFEVQDADGNVVGTASGTASPLEATLDSLTPSASLQLKAVLKPTGVAQGFEGTVTFQVA